MGAVDVDGTGDSGTGEDASWCERLLCMLGGGLGEIESGEMVIAGRGWGCACASELERPGTRLSSREKFSLEEDARVDCESDVCLWCILGEAGHRRCRQYRRKFHIMIHDAPGEWTMSTACSCSALDSFTSAIPGDTSEPESGRCGVNDEGE